MSEPPSLPAAMGSDLQLGRRVLSTRINDGRTCQVSESMVSRESWETALISVSISSSRMHVALNQPHACLTCDRDVDPDPPCDFILWLLTNFSAYTP